MSKGKDEFGDRMKMYESVEAGRRFIPLLPVVARLDGKNFSRLTRRLQRPYDQRFSNLMTKVTKKLVEITGAHIGYTQSDEISLAFYSPDIKSQIYFDGRIAKMTSVLASIATLHFNINLHMDIIDYIGTGEWGLFDCRVWQLPTLEEATNAILWRELDATKNSVSMAARHYYSHKELLDLGRADMMDLLHEKGVNWNDYPAFFKRGVYVQKRKRFIKFSAEELERLPEKHQARTNPDLELERSEVVVVDMPPLSKVINRVDVIFKGADPVCLTEEKDES